jgi:electron transfer flavoprotein alpha/beta subunit
VKVIVCVKQVPDTETRVKIAPEGNAMWLRRRCRRARTESQTAVR